MSEETKRLFVAISLPSHIKEKLEEIENELKPFARDAKWVKVDNIHLTLKFLGYVDPARIPDLSKPLSSTAENHSAFEVTVRGCGAFPNSRRPNVLWVGVESKDMSPLQQSVEEAIVRIGFEKEERPFSPHLTIARFKNPKGLIPLMQEVEKTKDRLLGQFTVMSFSLYESILHREGAEYKKLESFRLEGTRQL